MRTMTPIGLWPALAAPVTNKGRILGWLRRRRAAISDWLAPAPQGLAAFAVCPQLFG